MAHGHTYIKSLQFKYKKTEDMHLIENQVLRAGHSHPNKFLA